MPKIGVEIHQRIFTHKLFCSCPYPEEEPVERLDWLDRRLHPVLSEMGEIDEAARLEAEKGRLYQYTFNDNICLVEMDEEPPHEVNREALKVALNVALQMDMQPVNVLVFMRKMVLDGSNTSGFQRTALLAIDGKLSTSRGDVGIQTLCLEEESAGIEGEDSLRKRYSLFRLGIPLIEIATTPDIKDGKHAREVCEKIGLILRSTGKAARGIGTIRQDLNVSVEGGARVEIKGAQELNMIAKWVDNEIKRQKALLTLIAELESRGAYEALKAVDESYFKDVTDIIKQAVKDEKALIRRFLKGDSIALAVKLPKHAGFLGRELALRRYGSELSDYAKQRGVGGIIHSDEKLAKYGLDDEAVKAIKEALDVAEDDAFIMVVASAEKAKLALSEALRRAKMAYVPKETRKALPDGSTAYMRPLPGAARMYPETDVPYVKITPSMLEEAKALAESYEEKVKKLKALLNNDELVQKMLHSKRLSFFERLVGKGIEPKMAAITLEDTLTKLRREGCQPIDENVEWALLLYSKGHFTKKTVEAALKGLCEGKAKAALQAKLAKLSKAELESLLKTYGDNMKAILREHGLRVDPAELKKLIDEAKKKA